MTTILKKGSSSDYITVKKQMTISGVEKTYKTINGNYNFIDTTNKCLQNAASFDLLYSLRKGNKNCCDISTNSVIR